jgi:hypothetical protein
VWVWVAHALRPLRAMTINRSLAATLLLACPLAASACSSSGPEAAYSEGADTVDTQNAKVLLCGSESGCAPCSANIGGKDLSQAQQDSCRLLALRSQVVEWIPFLVAEAGRRGYFVRSVGQGANIRLSQIALDTPTDVGSAAGRTSTRGSRARSP